jgi:hypothetical protein
MKTKLSGRYSSVMIFVTLALLAMGPSANAAGLFGAPQTVSQEAGGLNTAIGYVYDEDVYENGARHIVRKNSVYSQVAYGAKNIWETYARIGMSDFKMADAFASTDSATVTDKKDFREHWKFFGTLGAKAFYRATGIFGAGVFIQGTYYFSDFRDDVSGEAGGVPFNARLKVKNLWDVNCGLGFQITLPYDVRLYGGPYVYYSESKMALDTDIPGIDYSGGHALLHNRSIAGGFAGLDMPLAKGFRLNIEGKYSERWSAGAAISYSY